MRDGLWSEQLVDVDGARLLVRDSGGDGAPVLLLHGLGGYAGEWRPVAERLATDHRVVAFDQRGHGSSTRRPDRVDRDAYVNDVVTVIEALDLAPLVLVGQSMGAHTALLAAAARPDLMSSLVLVEGGVGGEGPDASADVIAWFRSWPVPFPDVQAAADHFGGGEAGRAWAAGLEASEGGLVPAFDADVLHAAILDVHARAQWDAWRSVTRPVLMVKGSDGFLPADEARDMLAANPRARLVEVAGAGHDVHLGAPDALVREMRASLG